MSDADATGPTFHSMPPHLLLVDDDPTLLAALTTTIALRIPGSDVHTASSAQSALSMIEAIDFDAIVSDIKMPRMDGFELMAAVLKIRPTTPTLLITGHGDHELAVNALNAGAYAFIPKPIDRDFFIAWLKRAIQLRQLSRTVERQNEHLERTVQARTEELEVRNQELKAVIAAQAESAKALRKSEDMMARAQRAAHAGTWEIDLLTGRITWSDPYRALFSIDRETEPSVDVWLARIHPDDRPRIAAEYQDAIEHERDHNMQFRVLLPEGTIRWMHRQGQVERDADGRAVRVSGITLDITARKHAEEALRWNEAQMRLITDALPVLISYIDGEQRYRFVNRAYEEWFGQSRAAITGCMMRDILGEAAYETLRPHVEEVLKGVPQRFAGWLPYKHVGERYVDVSYVPDTEAGGRVCGFFVIVVDISEYNRSETALRESEERFRQTVEANPNGILLVDEHGHIALANAAIESMFGYDRNELVHQPVDILVSERSRGAHPGHRALFAKAPSARPMGAGRDLKATRKDGTEFPVEIGLTPIKMANASMVLCSVVDITARKRAEEKARANERLLSLIFNQQFTFSALLSPEGRVLKLSESVYRNNRSTDIRPEALIGQMFLDAPWWQDLPETVAEWRRQIQEALERPGPARGEAPYRLAGEWRYAINSVTALRDEQGHVEYLLAEGVDITPQKLAEERLRAREAELRLITDNAPLYIAHCDTDGRYKFVNKPYAERFGLRPEDCIGKRISNIVGEAAYESFRHYIDEALAGRRVEFEVEVPYKAAGPRFVQCSYVPDIAPDGTVRGLVAVILDVTSRRYAEVALQESEARFKALADNMSQLAWMADGTGWIFWYNQRWYDYTGTTFEGMQGWGWQQIHHPEHVDRVVAGWKRAHATGEPWEDTFPLRGTDGRFRWFLSRAMPIRDAEGRVTRWFGTNTDVTDLREAQEEIRHLLDEARRREQELRVKHDQLIQAAKLASIGELASGVAHELNNPLNNIGLFVGNVMDDLRHGSTERDRMLQHLDLARQQVNKAASIITHLRTFARRPKAFHEPVSVNDILRAAVSLMDVQLQVQNVSLRLDLDPNDPMVSGNPIQLEQVFLNLLGNARDALEGSIDKRITMTSRCRRTHVDVTITDSGPGIPADVQAHIFEAFFTTKDVGKGTGLGLSISHGIITEHQGAILVESEVGQGATFTVRLPLSTGYQ